MDQAPSPDKLSGLESAAAALLKRAVLADKAREWTEALTCYKEGIELLLSILKGCDSESKKAKLRERVKEYMDRAEKLKIVIQREKSLGQYHEQIQIEDGAVGFSYERIFKGLLDDEITAVEVVDPYIRSHHQLMNFLRFSEMVVKHLPGIRLITLKTSQETGQERQTQSSAFSDLTKSLASRGVRLEVLFESTLHDREIILNNGWIVKIGRGLDYFKPVSKFSLGYCDYDLRPCHATTVDIFHQKYVKKS